MATPFLRLPGASRTIQMGATHCAFHVTGAESDGQAGLFEIILEPGARGAGLHLHRQLTEVFYVVAGTITLLLNEEQVQASAGATMYAPPGTPHGFANPGDSAATLLVLFWPPAEREQFFEGFTRMARQEPPPTTEEALAFMARFDQYPVG